MSLYGAKDTPKEVMLILASNLRATRKEQKLTQRTLAELSGVAYASLKKFESTGIISLESFLKLCSSLNRLTELKSILLPHNIGDKQNLFDI